MSEVILYVPRVVVKARCRNQKCRAPVVTRQGSRIRLYGKGPTMAFEGDTIHVSGQCPACQSPYDIPDLRGLADPKPTENRVESGQATTFAAELLSTST